MLGEALIDPHGIDGNAPGLGLLPLVTVFATEKTVRHTQVRFDGGLAARPGPWSVLASVPLAGYEIHHGNTQEFVRQHPGMAAAGDCAHAVLPNGLGWQNGAGNVLGLYLHGLFEDAQVMQAFFGSRLQGPVPTLDTVFDGLAQFIGQHFAPGALQGLIHKESAPLAP